MTTPHPKVARTRIQALVLVCALTGVYFSSLTALWFAPAPAEDTLKWNTGFTKPVIPDSRGRLEKRAASLGNKTYRRHLPLALLPSPVELAVRGTDERWLALQQSDGGDWIAAMTLSDRAPPLSSL